MDPIDKMQAKLTSLDCFLAVLTKLGVISEEMALKSYMKYRLKNIYSPAKRRGIINS